MSAPEVAPAGPLGACVDAFDQSVARRVDAYRSPTLDRLFYGLSSAADHSLLWFVLGAIRTARVGKPRVAVRFAIAMSVESALTNGAIKSAFRRVRPSHDHPPDGPLPYGMRRPITSSFPSGHATAAFTAATLLADRHRGKVLWFGFAGLVAGSRVYVRMHHASDVVAGAAVGVVLGQIFRRMLPLE